MDCGVVKSWSLPPPPPARSDNEKVTVAGSRTWGEKGKAKSVEYVCPNCKLSFGHQKKKCYNHIVKCIPGPTFQCHICNAVEEKNNWGAHMNVCGGYAPGSITAQEAAKMRNDVIQFTLLQHNTRSKAELSAGGDMAIVKKVTVSGKRHKGKCRLAVDPDALFQLCCTKAGCNVRADMSDADAKPEYLWCRRRTKRHLGLLSASAPLDADSCLAINNLAASCGIWSNTTSFHLTLAEGLRPPHYGEGRGSFESLLSSLTRLRSALFAYPRVTIRSLRAIARQSDAKTVLFVARVWLSRAAHDAVRGVPSSHPLALPQFPLHVALGVCGRENADAILKQSRHWVGLTLSVDARYLCATPPSLEERGGRRRSEEAAAKRFARNVRDFGAATNVAVEVANCLNAMLWQTRIEGNDGDDGGVGRFPCLFVRGNGQQQR